MSYITKKVEINGVIDTGQFCLDNLQTIADSSQAFVSWDPIDGLWVANINSKDTTNPNSLERIFSDSNILGPINVTGLGINSLYNVATATFYDERLKGTKDEVRVFIRDQDRLEYEVENTLSLDYALVNDPGQAAYAASVELKTSRVQYSIEFTTDYTEIGIRAGEIIGIRNELYFSGSETTPKKFRVVSVEEIDTEDGGIALSITAVEYDDDVYDITGFSIEERNKNTRIIPKEINVEIGREENVSIGKQVAGIFAAGVIDGIIDSVFSVDPRTGAISQSITPQNNLETLLDDYASGVLNDLITDYDDGTLNVAAAISVDEEGTEITPTVDSFNFVGGAILAEATGNAVTVTCNATPDPDGTLADVISDYEAGLLGGGSSGPQGNTCNIYVKTFFSRFTELDFKAGGDPYICNPTVPSNFGGVDRPEVRYPFESMPYLTSDSNYTLKITSTVGTLWYDSLQLSSLSLRYNIPSTIYGNYVKNLSQIPYQAQGNVLIGSQENLQNGTDIIFDTTNPSTTTTIDIDVTQLYSDSFDDPIHIMIQNQNNIYEYAYFEITNFNPTDLTSGNGPWTLTVNHLYSTMSTWPSTLQYSLSARNETRPSYYFASPGDFLGAEGNKDQINIFIDAVSLSIIDEYNQDGTYTETTTDFTVNFEFYDTVNDITTNFTTTFEYVDSATFSNPGGL